MRIFAISDTHLSFGMNIDKPMDVFGGSWLGYEDRLRKNWKSVVEPEDLVLVPGDISWALHLEDALSDLAWIDALPGKKLLVRGNHDLWWASMAKMRGLFPTILFLQNDSYYDPEHGFGVIGSRGWICPDDPEFSADDRKIYDRELLRLGLSSEDLRKKMQAEPSRSEKDFLLLAMTHYPPTSSAKAPTGFTDMYESLAVSKAVYGHLHSAKAFDNGPRGIVNGTEYMLVSADYLDFTLQLVASR